MSGVADVQRASMLAALGSFTNVSIARTQPVPPSSQRPRSSQQDRRKGDPNRDLPDGPKLPLGAATPKSDVLDLFV